MFGQPSRAGLALLSITLPLALPPTLASQSDHALAAMAGLSNQGRNPDKPYAAAGDRAYLIGTQDGNFPDLGDHVPGEMGGLWLQPIKLIDGFRAVLSDSAGQEYPLLKAREFINYPYGNRLRYGLVDGIDVDRFQFSPDGQAGVVVQYILTNRTDRPRNLTLRVSVKTDLRPVWFSEKLGITDAPDTVAWNSAAQRFVARDTRHTWYAVWGAPGAGAAEPLSSPDPLEAAGPGVIAGARYRIAVDPHATDTLTLVFAGSPSGRAEAEGTYALLSRQHAILLDRKKARYIALLERSRIHIPDQRLQEVYNWVKINMEWLIKDVPGIGRGLTGALPEYPWWFGTESYSLQACLASGNAELAKQTLRLLRDQSEKANGNGRIIHEVTTNGGVSNRGNTQETAQWVLTAGMVYDWTGDRAFARNMYPAMKQGLHWLLTDMDTNRNLFPEGYGIMEVLGLNAELIDVSVYTHQALLNTARIADVLGEPGNAARYRKLASQLGRRIHDRFWIEEESSYADFYGTRAQAISVAAGAARQLGLKGEEKLTDRERELIRYYEQLQKTFAGMPDTSRGWLTNKNWVIATPMEMGMAPQDRAIRALDKIRNDNLGEHGPYLSATERLAMMTISTGVQAVAEANYGRTDEALWYMDKIVRTFNRTVPGSISEMMPDYGSFTIAWTAYGIVLPLVRHVFGIQPDAGSRTVVLQPQVPSGWDDMSIEDVPVGTNLISFSRSKTNGGIEYRIDSRESGWTFVLKGPAVAGAKHYLNGKPVAFPATGIRMSGKLNRLLVAPS